MLFLKECKKILFSLTFLLYALVVFGMFFTQFYADCNGPLEQPAPGLEDYGTKVRETPEILMPAAADNLINEYNNNSYTAYPFGFYKVVRLNNKKQEQIAAIIDEISLDVSYERFRELMREADVIIGGGSEYSDSFILQNFSRVPKTYEDALEDYNNLSAKDGITGGYARLFCDYSGIFLAIMPVFVAAALCNADQKARMEQLIYSRKISSARLIITRYCALILTMLIPVLITALIAHFRVVSIYPDSDLDRFAILKLAAVWLIPNIMTTAAVGMLVTELLSPLIAVFVQGAWWFKSALDVSGGLTGDIEKFTFVVRHNSILKRAEFLEDYGNFIFSRSFYTVLPFILIALTILIYEMKRGGRFHGLRTFGQNHRSKSEA